MKSQQVEPLLLELTPQEIQVIKNARTNELAILLFLIFVMPVLVVTIFIEGLNDDLEHLYVKWLFNIGFFITSVNAIKRLLDFSLDIKNGQKIVLTSMCKKIITEGEDGQRTLQILGYGGVPFTEGSFLSFAELVSEEFELYDIHLAPRSKIILGINKMDQVGIQNNAI
jgi:hypothetical protein